MSLRQAAEVAHQGASGAGSQLTAGRAQQLCFWEAPLPSLSEGVHLQQAVEVRGEEGAAGVGHRCCQARPQQRVQRHHRPHRLQPGDTQREPYSRAVRVQRVAVPTGPAVPLR